MKRLGFGTALLVMSCSRPAPPPPAQEPAPHFGAVMAEVGMRFERSGKAAAAGRFDLAAFEAGELGELFEDDVPRAELPKEGATAHIHPMAATFAKTFPPQLEAAAKAHDMNAFRIAFATASSACNTCHQASEKPFIEIPSVPGSNVPDLSPK